MPIPFTQQHRNSFVAFHNELRVAKLSYFQSIVDRYRLETYEYQAAFASVKICEYGASNSAYYNSGDSPSIKAVLKERQKSEKALLKVAQENKTAVLTKKNALSEKSDRLFTHWQEVVNRCTAYFNQVKTETESDEVGDWKYLLEVPYEMAGKLEIFWPNIVARY